MPLQLAEVLRRRSDLSTFLVHLTRDTQDQTAKQALLSILAAGRIEARNPMGHALDPLRTRGQPTTSQRVVCFTETPLEYTHLLVEELEGRACQFGPYGVALTKKQGRWRGINPVWYVDISPTGREWLSNSINALAIDAIDRGGFDESAISKIAPFIEQMGTGPHGGGFGGYRKEFWWEREWRHRGDFLLPARLIVLSPADDAAELRAAMETHDPAFAQPFAIIDPRWSLEQIIAHLANFTRGDIDLV